MLKSYIFYKITHYYYYFKHFKLLKNALKRDLFNLFFVYLIFFQFLFIVSEYI